MRLPPPAALLLVAAALGTACGAPGADPGPVPAGAPVTTAPAAHGGVPADRRVAPAWLRIPAIDVHSAVVPIGVDGAGALVPPEDTATTGWYAAGSVPGAPGQALIAGHVDSSAGPAVFYRLRDLPRGALIEIGRADGTTTTFRVRRTGQTPKAAFPTAAVYAPTPAPELRLVTCGGTFDHSAGHYRDNVVVEAVAADTEPWRVPERVQG